MYIKNKSPAFSCLYSGKLQASNLASKYSTPLNNLGAQKLETSETSPGHANFKLVERQKNIVTQTFGNCKKFILFTFNKQLLSIGKNLNLKITNRYESYKLVREGCVYATQILYF